MISGFISHRFPLPFGRIGRNGSTEQIADSIWHLFRSIAVWRLSVEFLRLVPYLMSFSLTSHTFELKGMLFLVVRYQHLSVSLYWQMALSLQIICRQATFPLHDDLHLQAPAWWAEEKHDLYLSERVKQWLLILRHCSWPIISPLLNIALLSRAGFKRVFQIWPGSSSGWRLAVPTDINAQIFFSSFFLLAFFHKEITSMVSNFRILWQCIACLKSMTFNRMNRSQENRSLLLNRKGPKKRA